MDRPLARQMATRDAALALVRTTGGRWTAFFLAKRSRPASEDTKNSRRSGKKVSTFWGESLDLLTQFKQSFAMEWTRKKQGNPPQPRRYGQVQPRVEKRDGFRLWSAWTTMVGRHVARLRYRRDTRPSQSMHVVEAPCVSAGMITFSSGTRTAQHHSRLHGLGAGTGYT